MLRLLFTCSFVIFCSLAGYGQMQDYISLKKRSGVTVRNYYANGWPISFKTASGYYEGPIAKIENDSVYVKFFQINRLQTVWNTLIYDTVNVYVVPFHYKEIREIVLPQRRERKRLLGQLGRMMQLGGIGYDVVNIVNSLYYNDKITGSRNLRNLGIATGVAAAGVAINRGFLTGRRTPRNYRIVYVKMQ